MAAPKLVELEDGLQVFASSNMELQFLHEEIFHAGCYDDINLPEHAFVVDVGANIGMFSIFIKRNYPDAQILAFEPAPETARILRQNLDLHGLSADVTVHEVGLGGTADPAAHFTYYPALPGNTTRYPDQKGPAIVALTRFYSSEKVAQRLYRGQDITVPVERLSAYLTDGRPVDLLKVDVEGDELDVLLGIDDAHWPLIRQAIMEVQDYQGRLGAVCDLLASHGLAPAVGPAPMLDEDMVTYMVHAVRK